MKEGYDLKKKKKIQYGEHSKWMGTSYESSGALCLVMCLLILMKMDGHWQTTGSRKGQECIKWTSVYTEAFDTINPCSMMLKSSQKKKPGKP